MQTRTEEQKKQAVEDAQSTFISFARQGFVHVLPLGLDHILFVIGNFLIISKMEAYFISGINLYPRPYHHPWARNLRSDIRTVSRG